MRWTGAANRYVALNDRGYNNGLSSYTDRMQIFDITVDPEAKLLTATLVATRLLRNERGPTFTGLASAIDKKDVANTRRLDPEGVAVSPTGTIYISDEYGPFIYEIDGRGRRIRSIKVPPKFLIAHPSGDADKELPPQNMMGRQANRGMEGLTITPDGKSLVGIMQSPVIQDGALNAKNKRVGINIRILKIDIATGKTSEYVYQLDSPKNGVSEIIAVNDHQFLVDERDGNSGSNAKFKKIFLIDLSHATEVSKTGTSAANGLPASELPLGLKPASKSLFIDMLDPRFKLASSTFPEKVESLAWGPPLPDGRLLLIVASDNDLVTADPSFFWAFAIDPRSLPGYAPEKIDKPFILTPGAP